MRQISCTDKAKLRSFREKLDPLILAQAIERRLAEIFTIADEIQDDCWQEILPMAEPPASAAEVADSVPAPLAYARCASTTSATSVTRFYPYKNTHKTNHRRVS